MGYLLPKGGVEALKQFFAAVLALPDTLLVAPLKESAQSATRDAPGNATLFRTVKAAMDVEKLDFSKNPEFTVKKWFMPAYEPLYVYDRQKQKIVSEPKKETTTQVLFGLRLCDLNAVKVQDKLFLRAPHPDASYKQRRDRTILIGYYCDTIPSEYCFCSSMHLTNYYDLMFRDKGDAWYIDVGSERGAAFIEPLAVKLGLTIANQDIPPIETPKRLHTHDIERFYDHPRWKEVVEEKCLSCERCTILCPTCMCFHMYDQITDDLQHGQKERTWESCHNVRFSRVAGDHFFRSGREQRFKHRIWHKISYFPQVFGQVPMCTGCGRCIEHCPTVIDWVEIINGVDAETRR